MYIIIFFEIVFIKRRISVKLHYSTRDDNIFIFHTGLGSNQKLLEFPAEGAESDLHAEELIATLKHLYKRKSYKKVMFI